MLSITQPNTCNTSQIVSRYYMSPVTYPHHLFYRTYDATWLVPHITYIVGIHHILHPMYHTVLPIHVLRISEWQISYQKCHVSHVIPYICRSDNLIHVIYRGFSQDIACHISHIAIVSRGGCRAGLGLGCFKKSISSFTVAVFFPCRKPCPC